MWPNHDKDFNHHQLYNGVSVKMWKHVQHYYMLFWYPVLLWEFRLQMSKTKGASWGSLKACRSCLTESTPFTSSAKHTMQTETAEWVERELWTIILVPSTLCHLFRWVSHPRPDCTRLLSPFLFPWTNCNGFAFGGSPCYLFHNFTPFFVLV